MHLNGENSVTTWYMSSWYTFYIIRNVGCFFLYRHFISIVLVPTYIVVTPVALILNFVMYTRSESFALQSPVSVCRTSDV